MRIACIIQTRLNSTRLPRKIEADIGGKPMLWHVMNRAKDIGIPVLLARAEDFPHLDESDVLSRYWEASSGFDAVMRITSDCPLIDPQACRDVLNAFGYHDYAANDLKSLTRYPDGLGCEIFKRSALKWAHVHAKGEDREHVTQWIRRHCKDGFECFHVSCPYPEATKLKLSVDTQEDLELVRRIDAACPHDHSLAATLEALGRAQAQTKA